MKNSFILLSCLLFSFSLLHADSLESCGCGKKKKKPRFEKTFNQSIQFGGCGCGGGGNGSHHIPPDNDD